MIDDMSINKARYRTLVEIDWMLACDKDANDQARTTKGFQYCTLFADH